MRGPTDSIGLVVDRLTHVVRTISTAFRRDNREKLWSVATILLAAGSGLYGIYTLGPIQEALRIALGLSDNQISLLQGPILYFPTIAASIPIGYIIDRYPRARVLALFVALQTGCILLSAVAPNFSVMAIARASVGVMSIAILMTVCALVADTVAAERRGRVFVFFGIAQVVASAGAFALGGKLLAHFGSETEAWRYALGWLAAPLLPILGLCLWLPEPASRSESKKTNSFRSVATQLWRYKAMLVPLAFGTTITGMGYSAALIWATPIYTRSFELPPAEIGALMGGILLAGGILGPVLGGIFTDLAGRSGGPQRTMSLMILLTFLQIPAGFFGVMPTVLLACLLLVVFSTIANMLSTVTLTLTTVAIPSELLGVSFGVQNGIAVLFTGLSPVMVSQLASRAQAVSPIGSALGMVCMATSLLGIVMFALGRRHFPRHPQTPRSGSVV